MTARFGRPSKLNTVMLDHVLQSVSEGLSLSDAADEVGVSERTLRRRIASDPDFAGRLREALSAGRVTAANEAANESLTEAPSIEPPRWVAGLLGDALLVAWSAERADPRPEG